MNKPFANAAMALLISLGAVACSSGGSSSPGISVEEYQSQQSVKFIADYKTQAENGMTTLKQEISQLQSALNEVEQASTSVEANAALVKMTELVEKLKSAAKDVTYSAEQAQVNVTKASRLSSTAASDAAYISSLTEEAKTLLAQAENFSKAANNKVAALVAAETAQKLKEQQYQNNINQVKQYSNEYFANDGSAIYGYLTDEAQRQKLQDELKNKQNVIAGTCAATNTARVQGACSTALPKGTLLAAYKQSYSSYAAIREDYNQKIDDVPSNSFVYLVDTPTTSKAVVTDATYKGQASYSYRNNSAITTLDGLTLTVKGDSISGDLTRSTTSGKGVTTTTKVITFNDAAIKETNGTVGFNGNATFHYGTRAFNTTDKKDFEGTYKGQFGGTNAEEVVGTFESTSTKDNNSVQGAFAASK